ncbi:endolytic transglycosylase MltG [Spiribacter halobius]|uniref:Endolytic murein transglycosylase n=1 Tax=Sediminicurvatus halobius TaxID=2182432 RepID=A0A2U2N2I3_9GAMM|nr:endolytic transglycosylase MltG [Spiribacter halobius]
MRWLGIGLLLLTLAAGAGAAWLWQQWQALESAPIASAPVAEPVRIAEGVSFGAIARDLEGRGLVDDARLLSLYARVEGLAGRMQAGEYRVTPGMTAAGLLRKIAAGRVIEYPLTVVEGWRFRELWQALRAHPAIERTLPEDASDAEIMAAIGREGVHPEGRFLPETYRFPRGTTDVDFLRRANRALEETLEAAWAERQPDLPLEGPEDALILASIIEKETGVAQERRRIAGVFVRRLERGMRLQTDPTVIYGMGDAYDGNIRRQDLRRDTPYNTYTRAGLPPTPIALAGEAAIRAAVDPADGDSLYFVSRGDGSHKFSATLEEHNRAVQRYQLGGGG